ncbi:MAG: dienelactone hydrolase family protein [Cyclobacteriaceae bacterium]
MIHDMRFDEEVKVTVGDGLVLSGHLKVPEDAKAIIVFAHGSGSSRHSPRNNYVAEVLHKENFATLLIDLLSEEENQERSKRFDIDLLADRLNDVRSWIDKNPHLEALMVGLFGASTGAAAALKTVAKVNNRVAAIVSRGGRPDMASEVLDQIRVPVKLIVGGNDTEVLRLNQQAYDQLETTKDLQIIEGASHLFEEAGKLEEVADSAVEWFLKHA